MSPSSPCENPLGIAAGAAAGVDAAFPVEPRALFEDLAVCGIKEFAIMPGDEAALPNAMVATRPLR
jgi:hypothetical protein